MNRKYHASEHLQRGAKAKNRSWRNDASDRERFESSAYDERNHSESMRLRDRATTLDDIDKVNRYVEVLANSDEFNDPRSERVRTTRIVERPLTPPPPVISFQTERRNRRGRDDTHDTRTRRRNSRGRSPSPRRNSSFRHRADEDRAMVRRRRRQSNEIDLTDCTLSPLERALNRGSSSHMRNRLSSIEHDFQERHHSQRSDRREHERRARVERSSPPARDPKDLILTIIDEGPYYKNLSTMKWRVVESALCMIYLDIMREYPGPPPVCRDAGWFLGCAKLIECADERSLQLYQLALSRVGEVWPGARLKVVNRNEIRTSAIKVRCAAIVSAEPSDNHAILERIQYSNPDLPTSDWRVTSVGAPSRLNNERQILIRVGLESVPLIEERRGVIKYGFESITLKINRRDKAWALRVIDNGDNRRQRRWSGMEETDEAYQFEEYDDAIIISDSEEEDKDSDYS